MFSESIVEKSQFRLIKHKKHNLIINCDDFGHSKRRDEGIYELIQNGKISSLSVMMNGCHIIEGMKELNRILQIKPQIRDKLSIGLHFNLTEGVPVSKRFNSKQMINDGIFLGKAQFYRKYHDNPIQFIDAQFISNQFIAQVDQFITSFKARPTHIDGHNHVHIIKEITYIIAPLMSQMGLYKVRIPQQILENSNNPFNQMFVNNAIHAKSIFQSFFIIAPQLFVGLEDFGQLNCTKIDKLFDQYQTKNEKVYLELMCHPGYSDQESTCEFTKSKDRQLQKNQLQSQQFANMIKKYGGPSNFNDLEVRKKTQFRYRVLIISKMKLGTGNLTTSLRLKKILSEIGFQVYFRSIQQNGQYNQQKIDLENFLIKFKISLVFAVNITRTAFAIFETTRQSSKICYKVPYILIVAGTDANIGFKIQKNQKQFKKPIQQCLCLVAISQHMSQSTAQFLNMLKVQKNIYYIGQSSDEDICENSNTKKSRQKIILLPTSFRAVKCVNFLLQVLNRIIIKYDFRVIIVGPILDQNYYQQCYPLLNKIQYLGSLERTQYIKLLCKSFVVVNSSDSEGMSCSILEAFSAQVPVIARHNQGNLELINHTYNGMIFHTPEDFQLQFQQLIRNQSLKMSIIQRAKQIFLDKYHYSFEKKSYLNMIQKEFYSRFTMNSDKLLRFFNFDQVHPSSPVNLELYECLKDNKQCLKEKKQQKVLDVGCGSGIFGLTYLSKQDITKQISITFTDISIDIVSSCFYNVHQCTLLQNVSSMNFIISKMFSSVEKSFLNQCTILMNPPQTPFQKYDSRPDKNGGQDGFKFYPILISHFIQHSSKRLIVLHSLMANPQRLTQLLQQKSLSIEFQTKLVNHKIHKSQYERMEIGLSDYIKEHWQKGHADISEQEGFYIIPAKVISIVTKKQIK